MKTAPVDGPHPEDETGKGERQGSGVGGTRRENHITKSRIMRAAWWWIDRWRQSTAYTDMTAEEQGLYRNLLDEVWLREDHVIPDDPRILARVSGDPEAWERSGENVLRWMKHIPGGWTHVTALEVIGQSVRRAETQKRYRARVSNTSDNGTNNKADSPSPSLSIRNTSSLVVGRKVSTPSDPPADVKAEKRIRDSKVGDERRLLALVAKMETLDPDGRDAATLMQMVTAYDRADGKRVGGCVNPATLSYERVQKSIADAETMVSFWEEQANGPRQESAVQPEDRHGTKGLSRAR